MKVLGNVGGLIVNILQEKTVLGNVVLQIREILRKNEDLLVNLLLYFEE